MDEDLSLIPQNKYPVRVYVNDAAGNIVNDFGGGGDTPSESNITEIGGGAITLGQKTMASSFPVVLASNQSAILVETELPTAAALTDTNANPTTPIVGAALLVYNGSNFPRARSASASQDVDGTRVLGVGVAAQLDDTSPTSVTENNIGLVRMTPLRELAVTARMLPVGAVQINAASGNVANASAVATLANASGKTTYITGFEITAGGSTSGSIVSVTVTGTLGGTLTYTFAAPAGANVAATPLIVNFSTPVPASATNIAIVVTCPALGTGNTNATVVARGFQV